MEDILRRVLARSTRKDINPRVDPKLIRPTDEAVIWGDSTKLSRVTGWQPRISLDDTIENMLEYWRSKPDGALIV